MSNQQTDLFSHFEREDLRSRYGRTIHGGAKAKGRRKLERPLAANKPVHLILRSSRAKGAWSFLNPKNQVAIQDILQSKAKKFGVRIADSVNVGNHLHLKLRFSTRAGFQNFLRAITCLIARTITGAKRGKKTGAFWDALAYTRIIKTSFEELQLKGYFEANRIESIKGASARETYLRKFNAWLKTLNKRPQAKRDQERRLESVGSP